VVRAFEVECTTTMTSGLQRGSNLPSDVPKTMVIPEEREADFERKMKSPLFSDHFQKDNWTLLYFNTFREAFTKTKAQTALEPLFGQKKPVPVTQYPRESSDQQKLMEFGGSKESPENMEVEE
jgi:hypothetical protein